MRTRTGNSDTRRYDRAIPSDILAKIKERRRAPDGRFHLLREAKRAGRRVYEYPWTKMELGDFFIVDLTGRTERAVRVGLQQGANRHDFEIAIKPWKLPSGTPGLRVTVTIIGLTQWKVKASTQGVTGLQFSDGKYLARKRKWEAENRNHRPTTTPPPKKLAPRRANLDNPFWADNDPELPIAPTSMTPEVPLSREEMIRRAMGDD